MDDRETHAHLAFYSRALAEGSNDAERVGWVSVGMQKLRFEVFLEALHPSDVGPQLRVLDVGCGRGDLVGHLRHTGREVDYHGIDVHPEMVAQARARYPEVRFDVADLLDLTPGDSPAYDLVICSGALSLRFPDEETTWECVARLCALARWAAVFNLQSQRPLAELGSAALRTDFLHVDSAEALTRVRAICPDVVVREDIVASDIFFYCYKGYCRSLRQRPELTLVEQAEVLVQRRAYAAALELLRGAAGALGGRARYLEGVACAYLDRDDEAREALIAAHTAEPGDLDIAEGLVQFALASEELDLASHVVAQLAGQQTAQQAARRDKLRQPLHAYLVFNNKLDEACALETQAESRWAQLFLRGSRLVATRDYQDALVCLQAAVAAEPHNAEPMPLLGLAMVRSGRPVEALEYACAVLDVSHEHPVGRNVAVEALRKLARRVRGGGEPGEQALAAIERAALHAQVGPLASRFL